MLPRAMTMTCWLLIRRPPFWKWKGGKTNRNLLRMCSGFSAVPLKLGWSYSYQGPGGLIGTSDSGHENWSRVQFADPCRFFVWKKMSFSSNLEKNQFLQQWGSWGREQARQRCIGHLNRETNRVRKEMEAHDRPQRSSSLIISQK